MLKKKKTNKKSVQEIMKLKKECFGGNHLVIKSHNKLQVTKYGSWLLNEKKSIIK